MDTKNIEGKFQTDRAEHIKKLGGVLGKPITEMENLRETVGAGMEEGIVNFQMAPDGTSGKLIYPVLDESGKSVTKTDEITKPGDLAFYQGLQLEADRKKNTPR